MKTIKELEEMYDKRRMSYFWLGYEKALKDVLGLIDELEERFGKLSPFEELKARIER